ncbi:DUF2760 domain-containing protein [Vibrio rumoiensis]|uniref:DUF2760 domain-containing protein n=1 Tax=Vibrio rumoiensis 1S-45 TaxID=1188252 RepID=A0A1E5E1I6_9VIBR|nr:DUF2760 domain-containing protein [Vibrio rumoiensis]OEF25100.1 hypothetical protein A1QC_09715 [Vibrio rumoiensis 1S-45]
MTFDLTAFPTSFDILHIILAVTTVLFLLLSMRTKTVEKIIEKPVEKIVEVEKPVEKIIEVEKVVEVEKIVEKIVEVESKLKTSPTDSALQLMSIFQQEARLIDFLSEDLTGFSDEEVGAAARVIHIGGQKVLADHFTLSNIRTEDEETRISVPEGFNAQEVRLTGNVSGQAPFTGTLIHKGWKADSVTLPKLSENYDASILAPAEVEL